MTEATITDAGPPWGRIDDDGTVYVRTGAGERAIGAWHAGPPADGLAYYGRRYEALATEVTLLEHRLTAGTGPVREVGTTAERLRRSLDTAAALGDLDALAARLDAVQAGVQARQAAAAAATVDAAARRSAARRALVDEAERLAQSSDWKGAGDRLREIVEGWGEQQPTAARRAPRGAGRPAAAQRADRDLWRRLHAARDEFGRRRGAHFASLDEERAEARRRKEALAATAEELAESTDWDATGNRFRDLMRDWKAAGRAAKSVDDALWSRFRTAQDRFFARRAELNAERDAAFVGNLQVKERLLAEAEALDARRDLAGAERRLRELQELWEAAGQVPRDAASGLERRMAAVERRVRDAVEARWSRPDPSTSPMVTRLRESIDKLEKKAERARSSGRTAEVEAAEATLASQREWLAQAERA